MAEKKRLANMMMITQSFWHRLGDGREPK